MLFSVAQSSILQLQEAFEASVATLQIGEWLTDGPAKETSYCANFEALDGSFVSLFCRKTSPFFERATRILGSRHACRQRTIDRSIDRSIAISQSINHQSISHRQNVRFWLLRRWYRKNFRVRLCETDIGDDTGSRHCWRCCGGGEWMVNGATCAQREHWLRDTPHAWALCDPADELIWSGPDLPEQNADDGDNACGGSLGRAYHEKSANSLIR